MEPKPLTRLATVFGELYTELTAAEVRQYLQGGSRGGTVNGYADPERTMPGYIAVKNIVFVYDN